MQYQMKSILELKFVAGVYYFFSINFLWKFLTIMKTSHKNVENLV